MLGELYRQETKGMKNRSPKNFKRKEELHRKEMEIKERLHHRDMKSIEENCLNRKEVKSLDRQVQKV
ncbi:hypothetical protein AGMMS50222_07610 [Endomicrobiia bacterium]|nr:hypothetical protein AGMMS49950_07490 [Endomicrobiia bacterium]GHT75848.1 hypothetical protein AGMMS50222_07610 [Endomicrobiia bacterium]